MVKNFGYQCNLQSNVPSISDIKLSFDTIGHNRSCYKKAYPNFLRANIWFPLFPRSTLCNNFPSTSPSFTHSLPVTFPFLNPPSLKTSYLSPSPFLPLSFPHLNLRKSNLVPIIDQCENRFFIAQLLYN